MKFYLPFCSANPVMQDLLDNDDHFYVFISVNFVYLRLHCNDTHTQNTLARF